MDSRLKALAREVAGAAPWKTLVERLTDATPDVERIAVYREVREAGVLPADAVFFLFAHAIQWMRSEYEDLDQHEMALLGRFELDDMANLRKVDRLEYNRRHERGRQFFYGPPDAELAKRLREKGIID